MEATTAGKPAGAVRWVTQPLPPPTERAVVIMVPPGKRFTAVARRLGHYWRIASGVPAMVKALTSPDMAYAPPTNASGLPPDMAAALVTAPACTFPDDTGNREYPGLCWYVATGCPHCMATATALTATESEVGRAAVAAQARMAAFVKTKI